MTQAYFINQKNPQEKYLDCCLLSLLWTCVVWSTLCRSKRRRAKTCVESIGNLSNLYFARGLLPCNMLWLWTLIPEKSQTPIKMLISIQIHTHVIFKKCETKTKKETQEKKTTTKLKIKKISKLVQYVKHGQEQRKSSSLIPRHLTESAHSTTATLESQRNQNYNTNKQHTTKTREIKIKTTTTAEQQ